MIMVSSVLLPAANYHLKCYLPRSVYAKQLDYIDNMNSTYSSSDSGSDSEGTIAPIEEEIELNKDKILNEKELDDAESETVSI